MAKKQNSNSGQSGLFKQKVPKMPEGYYSGDKPNPNLKAFVNQHIKEYPYDPRTDKYNIPAFDKPIETTKATTIYNMHTYWSKKPHDAIRQYIRHYTKPGDLVLDSFCGSGGTALAALMENRKAIAIDLSPAATFITKNYCAPVDIDELFNAYNTVKCKIQSEINWLYETKCDKCGGIATTSYAVFSKVYKCPRCLKPIALFDCDVAESTTLAGKPKKISVCPSCSKRGIIEEINAGEKTIDNQLMLVSYICKNGCKPARRERRYNDENNKKREYFAKYDLGKIQEIEKAQIPYWYPKDRMMNTPIDQERWGLLWRPYLRGIDRACDFHTKRNLWALSAVYESINTLSDRNIIDILKYVFTGTLLNVSKLIQIERTRRSPNTYYVPPIGKEISVISSFESKLNSCKAALNELNKIKCREMIISTQTAQNLSSIASNSIDYIFTDPPYGSRVQFGELNFLWESWLKADTTWVNQEIIINENRSKSLASWQINMKEAFAECYRVIKPGRVISVCYHDSDPATWAIFQDIMAEVGFITEQVESTLYIETGQKTHKQTVADNITKRDLIINFRKPKPNEVALQISFDGTENKNTFREKTQAIIREYLEANAGAARDKIYDEVISRMVRAGEMEAHNFDELLRQVAEEVKEPIKKTFFENEDPNIFGTHEISRWYLKETEVDKVDEAETEKEDSAAEIIASFITKTLKKHPDEEGVHYSDIFEQYIYAVKDKPRRQLVDWLLDYFYKTEDGTYRLPASKEEEKIKADGRAKGIIRRVKRYLAYIQQGTAIPDKERPSDATMIEWIRHCKRSGLYEQGKTLYEKGGLNIDKLPEEAQVAVEEDYQVCVRLLGRQTAEPKRRTRKGGQNDTLSLL